MAILLTGTAAAQTADTAQQAEQPVTKLPPVDVIGASPLIGSGIDRNLVPAETHVLNSQDLKREGTSDLLGSLNQQIGGISLDSASGNPFQPTLFYHGFAASGLQGTPQGLAVYVNGMRFNQPFGDTVDWDLIPNIAIDRINLVGSNPVFGLNALGGAVNVQLKNGFTYQGFEGDISGGSFGQVQGEFQYGKQVDNVSTYVAGTVLHQGGWRDLQSTETPEHLWRCRLAQRSRGTASECHGGALDPQRSRHVAGRTAGRRSGGPVHRAQSDRQPVRGGQPVRQRGRDRHNLDPGARVLPLLPPAGHQRQRAERHALQRRHRTAVYRLGVPAPRWAAASSRTS